MVAGSSGNLIVLLRHHENAVFDNRGYIYDGSSWALTNHPGKCGVQESTAVTTRNTSASFVIFLSACEPEALLFDTSSRSWQTQLLTHSAGPSRIVATGSGKMVFAGRMKTVTNVTNSSVYVETQAALFQVIGLKGELLCVCVRACVCICACTIHIYTHTYTHMYIRMTGYCWITSPVS